MKLNEKIFGEVTPRTMVVAFYRLALQHGHLWPTGQLDGLGRMEQELEAAETEEEAAEWAEIMSRVSFALDGPDGMGGVAFPDAGEPLVHTTGSGRSSWLCKEVEGRRAVLFEISRPDGICLRAKVAWDDQEVDIDLLDIEPESVAEPRHWDTLVRNLTDVFTRRHPSAAVFLAVAEALRESAKDFGVVLPDSYWESPAKESYLEFCREVGAGWAAKLNATLPADNNAAWDIAWRYHQATLSYNDRFEDVSHPRSASVIAEAMREGFIQARLGAGL